MAEGRPSMKNLFAQGALKPSNKNAKQQRLLQSLQWRQMYQTSEHYLYTFDEQSSLPSITIQQILNGEMKGLGTGTFVWPAAHVLAKYLEKTFHSQRTRSQDGTEKTSSALVHRVVLDLGTGTGLTGLVAASLGAQVFLTDQDCVLDLLRENVALYLRDRDMSPSRVSVLEYDWNDAIPASIPKNIDVILVSDCVLPQLYPIALLVSTLHALLQHCAPHPTMVLLSYEHRPFPKYDPRQEFCRLCTERGLSVSVLPLSVHHDVYRAEDIELWEVSLTGVASSPLSYEACSRERDRERQKASGDREETQRFSLSLSAWGEQETSITVSLISSSSSASQLETQTEIQQWSPSIGIGCVLWPSSILCSRLLMREDIYRRMKTERQRTERDAAGEKIVLDIGAGCGLTSIVAHYLGFSVVATDKPSLATSLLQSNLSGYLSRLSPSSPLPHLEARVLDWEAHPLSLSLLSERETVQFIVCSDCLYSSLSVQPLLFLLDQLCLRELSLSDREAESVSIQVLVVNEQRSALEEFISFSFHRPLYSLPLIREADTETQREVSVSVQREEIEVSPSDRTILRTATALHEAATCRAFWCTWTARYRVTETETEGKN